MHFSLLFSSHNFRKKKKKKTAFPVHLKNNIKKKVLPLKPWKVGFYLLILSYHSSVAVPAASPPLSLRLTLYTTIIYCCVLDLFWVFNGEAIRQKSRLATLSDSFFFFWLYSLSLFALNIQIILILVFIFCNTRSTILSVCLFNFFFSDKFYFTGLTRIEAIQSALQLRK